MKEEIEGFYTKLNECVNKALSAEAWREALAEKTREVDELKRDFAEVRRDFEEHSAVSTAHRVALEKQAAEKVAELEGRLAFNCDIINSLSDKILHYQDGSDGWVQKGTFAAVVKDRNDAKDTLREVESILTEHNILGHKLFGCDGKYPKALVIGQDVVLDGMKWLDCRVEELQARCINYEWKLANLPRQLVDVTEERNALQAKLASILDTLSTLR